jgi:NitT/TauT family transport system substrate-binding protein
MNKKTGLIVVIVLAFVVLFVWKYRTDHVSMTQSSSTIRIAVNPWIGSGLYYVADEKEFFKNEGLDVKLTDFADGSIGKQLMNTSEVDAIVSLTPETIQILNDAGIKVKVPAIFDTSDGADGVIATKEIDSIQELRGKSVAYESGSPSHLLFSYLLDQAGMTTADVKTVNLAAPDAGAAFVAGKVDAAVTWEPWLSNAKDLPGGHTVASTKGFNVLPGMPIFRADFQDKNQDAVKKFVKALFKAEEYIATNPNDSYEIIARRFGISVTDVTDQLGTFKWLTYEEQMAQFDTNNPNNIYQVIDKAGDLWLELGLIKTKVDARDVIDTSILKNLNS